jgi:DNA-binding MarR family transcriptional regulator
MQEIFTGFLRFVASLGILIHGKSVIYMKLAWMGEYRDVVEALIRYCNVYAASYKPEAMNYNGISFSFSQIQVLEYLLENEERNENMSAIAKRLGISRSNFTKIVNRLAGKGLLEKHHMPGSGKEMKLSINELGRELYNSYSQKILQAHFAPMFKEFEKIPKEYYPYIAMALNSSLVQCEKED